MEPEWEVAIGITECNCEYKKWWKLGSPGSAVVILGCGNCDHGGFANVITRDDFLGGVNCDPGRWVYCVLREVAIVT
jgi:hypothetical protein